MRTPVQQNECLIGSEFGKRLVALLDGAERHIEIIMFEWRWYENDPSNPMQLVNNALVRAARRGVAIRCITHNREIINTLVPLKIKAKKLQRRGLLHSKLILIDDGVAIIGSHNLTSSAMQSNVETSMCIPCKQSAASFKQFFERLWQS